MKKYIVKTKYGYITHISKDKYYGIYMSLSQRKECASLLDENEINLLNKKDIEIEEVLPNYMEYKEQDDKAEFELLNSLNTYGFEIDFNARKISLEGKIIGTVTLNNNQGKLLTIYDNNCNCKEYECPIREVTKPKLLEILYKMGYTARYLKEKQEMHDKYSNQINQVLKTLYL